MPSVEELLNEAENSIPQPINDFLEIDAESRAIVVPDSEKIFGVKSDERAERKYFRCQQNVGNSIDLSKLELYVVFQNASEEEGNTDSYHVTDVAETGDGYITFSWELSAKVTAFSGTIQFSVCAIKTLDDGTNANVWNTTIATGTCLTGLKYEMSKSESKSASDLYTQLITELNANAGKLTNAYNVNATEKLNTYTNYIQETGNSMLTNITQKGTEQTESINTLAETSKEEITSAKSASVTEIETVAQTQIDRIKENGGGVENALSNYFALRHNGKVFTTKLWKYETSTSPNGVKLNANEGMVCEPSVGRTEGRDDYAQYGLFQHFTCNFSVDENGFNHVDVLEGQTGFTKYGKVQVGEVTMSAWFGIEDTDEAVLYHYSDSQTELTPYPMKESINPDGTLSPFMIHAKYAAGDIDGVPYSSKGLAPASECQAQNNPVSYTGMITYMHKLGGHYCGTTSWDLFYRQLMMIIKYATTHSQSIMAGCTSYSNQNQNLVEETGVMRVVLTKAQAAGYVIGSYVSIGDIGTNTNKDRYCSYMHNKAFSVKVTKIEDVDDSNAAVYVDVPEAFDTTLTTWITTMPWHSGATDEVAGSDGSPNSNTNGKDPYKIQGIETCIGAYEVLGNVVMDIVTGADGNPARDVYVCEDASTLSSNIATVRANYKKAIAQVAYTATSWKYITEETTDPDLGIMIPTKVGGGSTTGFADGLNTDAGTSGQREWLALGSLNRGAYTGLWILLAYDGWSDAHWGIVSGVSPNGTRGEWQATA